MRLPVLAALLLSLATPVAAQDAREGGRLFQSHCASCHGELADGSGPLASEMTLKPRDLTRLAADNDGEFPTLRVVMRIDGREPLVAHGSPMPVFGGFFEGRGALLQAETGQPIMTSAPVVDLVEWLRGVQVAE